MTVRPEDLLDRRNGLTLKQAKQIAERMNGQPADIRPEFAETPINTSCKIPLALMSVSAPQMSEMSDEELAEYVEKELIGVAVKLTEILPFVHGLQGRYKLLAERNRYSDTEQRIHDCLSFEEFCRTVLHRNESTVYRALRKWLYGSKPKELTVLATEAEPEESGTGQAQVAPEAEPNIVTLVLPRAALNQIFSLDGLDFAPLDDLLAKAKATSRELVIEIHARLV